MAVYLVTWDLNKERLNYAAARTAFLQNLDAYPNKADAGLDSVRFVQSNQTAGEVCSFLRTKMDTNDRIVVSKLVTGQHQGWLAQTTWDWINSRL